MKRVATWGVLPVLLLVLFLTGCAGSHPGRAITDVNDLKNSRIGVNLAWESDYLFTENRKDGADIYRFDTVAEMILALRYHKLDAIATDDLLMPMVMNQISGLKVLEPEAGRCGYVAYMSPDKEKYLASFNTFVKDYTKSPEYQDHMDRLHAFDGIECNSLDIPLTGTGDTLRLAVLGSNFPRAFFDSKTGEAKGFDMEAVSYWANENNYRLDIIQSDYDDAVLGLQNGKYDIAVGYLSDYYRKDCEDAGVLVTEPFDYSGIHLLAATGETMKVSGVLVY